MLVKLEWLGYRMVKKVWPYVKPFLSDTGTLRTDGRTDRFAISITRVSMLTRDKKNSRVRRIPMSKPTVQQYQQCYHIANGNTTCRYLLLFKNNKLARGSQGFVGQSSQNVALRVEQPSVLNIFFSELQYSAAFGREIRKFAGGVWKYAKFRHFFVPPCSLRMTRKKIQVVTSLMTFKVHHVKNFREPPLTRAGE